MLTRILKRNGKYVRLNERLEMPASGVSQTVADSQAARVQSRYTQSVEGCACAGGLTRTGSRYQILTINVIAGEQRQLLECRRFPGVRRYAEKGNCAVLPTRGGEGMLYLMALPNVRNRTKE
jgi:hypothetical protein